MNDVYCITLPAKSYPTPPQMIPPNVNWWPEITGLLLGLFIVFIVTLGPSCTNSKLDPKNDILTSQTSIIKVADANTAAANSNDTHVTAITGIVPTGPVAMAVKPHLDGIVANDKIVRDGSITAKTVVVPLLSQANTGVDAITKDNINLKKQIDGKNLIIIMGILGIGAVLIILGVMAIAADHPKIGIAMICGGLAGTVVSYTLQHYAPYFGIVGIVGALCAVGYLIYQYRTSTKGAVQVGELFQQGLVDAQKIGADATSDAKAIAAFAENLKTKVVGNGAHGGEASKVQTKETQGIIASIKGKKTSLVRVAK